MASVSSSMRVLLRSSVHELGRASERGASQSLNKTCWTRSQLINQSTRISAGRSFGTSTRRREPTYNGASQRLGRIEVVQRPASEIDDEEGPAYPPQPGLFALLWPTAFVIGLGSGAFLLAAQQTNADSDQRLRELKEKGTRVSIGSWFNRDENSQGMAVDRALRTLRELEIRSSAQAIVKQISGAPELVRSVLTAIVERSFKTEAHQTVAGIIAINGVVFLAWRTPLSRNFMRRHFLDWPASGRAHTLLTAVFSHQSFLHFAFNNIALWSFGPPVLAAFFSNTPRSTPLPTSTSRYEFLAFFVAAGVVSSLGSQLWTTAVRIPRLLRASNGIRRLAPSLGASGAIYGVVVYFIQQYPHTQLSIIFLPMLPFEAQQGLIGMLCFDIANLLFRFVALDSAAHLAGALFGYLYFKHGHELFRKIRLELKKIGSR